VIELVMGPNLVRFTAHLFAFREDMFNLFAPFRYQA
jgi:hypothetical protein